MVGQTCSHICAGAFAATSPLKIVMCPIALTLCRMSLHHHQATVKTLGKASSCRRQNTVPGWFPIRCNVLLPVTQLSLGPVRCIVFLPMLQDDSEQEIPQMLQMLESQLRDTQAKLAALRQLTPAHVRFSTLQEMDIPAAQRQVDSQRAALQAAETEVEELRSRFAMVEMEVKVSSRTTIRH